MVDFGRLKLVVGPINFSTLSHVIHVDNIMVFCKGTETTLESFMQLIREYSDVFGHHLKLSKCKLFTGSISPRYVDLDR